MPGYYVHLASTNDKALKNKDFVKGIIMPDLLKHYQKEYSLSEIEKKYNKIKTNNMPEFSFFKKLLNNHELHFHYNEKSLVNNFWNNLTIKEKNNPFFRGYLWHLLTDYYTYQTLKLPDKLDIHLLHSDWDRLNPYITKTYPNIKLPKEVEELKIISFIDDNTYNYIDPNIIKEIIKYLRNFDILNGDVKRIIQEIKDKLE